MKWAAIILSGLVFAGTSAFAQGPTYVRVSKFSGKEVPRFETLKYNAVNGRAGPSRDHPILWRYERKGLPLLIIKESQNWRRVRDPSGAEVWVHARMLEPDSKAMVQSDTIIHHEPDPASPEIARVEPTVLVELGKCSDNWCRIEAGRYKGFVPASTLWGVTTSETAL
ncbi:MAG: SH3 domain-containing protein [Hyphomonas sp.]|nr:SH3 domain-containing protein [Hyphomonas sp.]